MFYSSALSPKKKRMELRNPSNGGTLEPPNPNGEHIQNPSPYSDDFDSNCSTPYVSAPSSPGRAGTGNYYFSAPASPMHYVLSSGAFSAGMIASAASPELIQSSGGSFEFGGSSASGPMISADELFLNGQIRPMKLSSHLQRPQALAPLLDLDEEEDEAKDGENGGRGREMRLSRSIHRRSRSMSPMRNTRFLPWEEEEEVEEKERKVKEEEGNTDLDPKPDDPVTASDSASSSRSSSSGRNSKRWIFLKDLLYRSKSDGGGRGGNGKEKEKFWSFSPAKDKSSKSPRIPTTNKKNVNGNGLGKRRSPLPSAHERLYTANRAQAEEMRRRTFLPYRQGLFGCLGFSSKGYGAVNGLAKTLNTVSSR